jgi:hypothetical protein
MKQIIDQLRDLEIQRLEKFEESAKRKILQFEEEATLTFKIYNNCVQILKNKNNDLEAFSEWHTDKKIEYLQRIQQKNSEIIEKTGKVEKVLQKLKDSEEGDNFKLLETNKDFSYSITFTKLKMILEKKLRKFENKLKSENCEILLNKMENLKSKKENSKVYYKNLNLKEGFYSTNFLIQPIDMSNMVNVFDVKEKKLSLREVKFKYHKGLTEVSQFPKFCRSINVRGKLYVIGGETDSSVVNYILEVDIDTLEARIKKGMEHRRAAHTLVNINNSSIIAISGAYGEKTCENYNIEKNYWSSIPSVKQDRIGASALVYSGETIYLFFGKRYDTTLRKWEFIDNVERINLYEKYAQWHIIDFKATSLDVSKMRAFSSLIGCPNDKIILIGGQTIEDEENVKLTENVLELDIEKQTIKVSEIVSPKESCFIDSNFYFFNSDAINFNNEGSIIMYSVVFNEMWYLENY